MINIYIIQTLTELQMQRIYGPTKIQVFTPKENTQSRLSTGRNPCYRPKAIIVYTLQIHCFQANEKHLRRIRSYAYGIFVFPVNTSQLKPSFFYLTIHKQRIILSFK